MANFENKPINLIVGQRVANSCLQPSAIPKSDINHAQTFGIKTDEKQLYQKT